MWCISYLYETGQAFPSGFVIVGPVWTVAVLGHGLFFHSYYRLLLLRPVCWPLGAPVARVVTCLSLLLTFTGTFPRTGHEDGPFQGPFLQPETDFASRNSNTCLEIYGQLQQGFAIILNPVDLIGRACKLGRQIDSRLLTQRVLEFYLIKVAVCLKRSLGEHFKSPIQKPVFSKCLMTQEQFFQLDMP